MDKKTELLAPAGSWDAFIAAVENGADAVYLGGRLFNARQYASNFDAGQLKNAVAYAHVRDVNVYLTMNTLVGDGEMREALDFVQEAYLLGIDGIIVQDLGLAGLIRKLLPDLSLHASTQMTVYNLEGVRMLEQLGFKRAVLARELSLDEISRITRNTSLEIEIFIHGALCISYSGQCLMSSMIGGRSGNRGKCAQPCRLPYALVSDGPEGKQWGKGFLLSPGDLCALPLLDKIRAANIKALKIEGRMKSPEYVATVVGIYRKYLDGAAAGTENGRMKVEAQDMKALRQIFNRGGFSEGHLTGKAGRELMCYEKPKNWGVYLGEVISYNKALKLAKIRLDDGISMGDGVEVWNGEEESPGTVVSEIRVGGKNVKSASAGDIAEIGSLKGRIGRGQKVYKTTDKKLLENARKSFDGKNNKKVNINGTLIVREGQPVTLTVEDRSGHRVVTTGEHIPQKALTYPAAKERILAQLQKTGGTPFAFHSPEVVLDEGIALSVGEVNDVRRKALEELERRRAEKYHRKIPEDGIEKKENLLYFPGNGRKENKNINISLFIYCWNENIDYAGLDADRLYIPFGAFSAGKTAETIARCKSKNIEIFIAIPAITKGRYDTLLGTHARKLSQAGADGVNIGNLGSLEFFMEIPGLKLAGDYPLNIFNSRTLAELAALRLCGATLSPELALEQIERLQNFTDFYREIIVYGRLPVMTSEYCPVGSIAGGCGRDVKCGEACKRGSYRLKDRMGEEFPVICDRTDCRSTLFNAKVLFLADHLDRIGTAGADILRLNMTDESAQEMAELVLLHRDILRNGAGAAKKYAQAIHRIKEKGFTKGHYFRGV